jgi:hypothetical protein
MSARSLTLRHMAKAVRRTREGEATDPEALGPDQMRLYSYYKPSLLAGDYVIEATQSISAPTPSGVQTLDILNTRVTGDSGTLAPQEFEVVVPRFSLDPKIINSYYPPDGHQDEGRILPHIVFNDPHYPWEIPAGSTTWQDATGKNVSMHDRLDPQQVPDTGGKSKTIFRGMVPWIALVVFDPEDLLLTLKDIMALRIPGYSQESDVRKQSPDGTFSMMISEYFSELPPSSRINYKAGFGNDDTGFAEITSMTSAVNVIFPTKDLFNQIFASSEDSDSHKAGIEAHKYMAHVRHINTVGFPDAGVEEEGLFSIVVSSRTGAYDIVKPHTQVCHLVSIENIDSTLGNWLSTPTSGGSDRVGLVSLFSWTYTALPPNPINFVDTMRNLTSNQQMLRVDDNWLAQLDAAANDGSVKSQAAKVMAARLKMGYTIARWRTQSGEESVAFNRGPLVPQPVTWPPAGDIPDCSQTSQDYQILDPQTGIMDLSYASAWQAGKLLAISDTSFSAALMRFRSKIHNYSADKTRMAANGMSTKLFLLSSIRDSVASIQEKSVGQTGDPQRFRPPSTRVVAPGLHHPDVKPTFIANVKDSVNANTNAGQEIYDEFNLDGPNNSDWALIHSWLSEKLSLGGIPPRYLIPEPSFLPAESLRFFHIDDFWLDCLLDGALSVANHLDKSDDIVRREIKEMFNIYLRKVVPDAGYKPQIPSYGFIIRSKLIKAMPDLRITVDWINKDNRAPVSRWTRWDSETLMCLLDRQPQELTSITLAQPSHQQRFSLGSHLDSTGMTFDLRRLYTKGAPESEWPEKPIPDSVHPNSWFNFTTRCLNIHQMAKDINFALQFGTDADPQAYTDPTPNSCEIGLELNDPSYYFKIIPPSNSAVAPRDRQLYVVSQASPGVQHNIQHNTISKGKHTTPNLLSQNEPSAPGAGVQVPVTVIDEGKPSTALLPRPPHQQLRMQPKSLLATKTPISRATTTVTSKFDLFIYPDYKSLPTRYGGNKFDAGDYIPTQNIYFFDLIFSIRKKPAQGASNFKLLKIDVDVPINTPSLPNPKAEVLLDANYDGPGLQMLSNLRFIPFLFNNDDGKLHIELVPRSANDNYTLTIDDRKSAELCFRLAEANVSQVKVSTFVDIVGERQRQERGLVNVTMTEWYATQAFPVGEAVSSVYKVVKWTKQDDSL